MDQVRNEKKKKNNSGAHNKIKKETHTHKKRVFDDRVIL